MIPVSSIHSLPITKTPPMGENYMPTLWREEKKIGEKISMRRNRDHPDLLGIPFATRQSAHPQDATQWETPRLGTEIKERWMCEKESLVDGKKVRPWWPILRNVEERGTSWSKYSHTIIQPAATVGNELKFRCSYPTAVSIVIRKHKPASLPLVLPLAAAARSHARSQSRRYRAMACARLGSPSRLPV